MPISKPIPTHVWEISPDSFSCTVAFQIIVLLPSAIFLVYRFHRFSIVLRRVPRTLISIPTVQQMVWWVLSAENKSGDSSRSFKKILWTKLLQYEIFNKLTHKETQFDDQALSSSMKYSKWNVDWLSPSRTKEHLISGFNNMISMKCSTCFAF